MNAFLKEGMSERPSAKADKFLFLRSRFAGEDGLVCVAMMLNCHGHPITLKALRRRYPRFRRGMTVRNMIEVFASKGLRARALQCDVDNLSALNMPCIAHWDWRRFAVLKSVAENMVSVANPTSRIERLNFAQLGWHYSGTVVEIQSIDETDT